MNRKPWVAAWMLVLALSVCGCGSGKPLSPVASQSATTSITAPVPDEKLTLLIAECARELGVFSVESSIPNVIDSGVVYMPSYDVAMTELLSLPQSALGPSVTTLEPYQNPAYVAVLRGRFYVRHDSVKPEPEMWVLIPSSALIVHPNLGDGVCTFDDRQSGFWKRSPTWDPLGRAIDLPADVLTRKTPS